MYRIFTVHVYGHVMSGIESEHAEVNMADWNFGLRLEYELMNPWGYSEMKDQNLILYNAGYKILFW